jgi:hypothetical protein
MNFVSAIVDEIALEGLDGITLPDLLTRLQNRKRYEDTGSIFADITKHESETLDLIWKVVRNQKDIKVFQLETARSKLEQYYR